jgi:hypothetical protein
VVVTVADHHTHERRFGRVLTNNQFSCAIYRATSATLKTVKPLLLYEMEWRYCIKCNASHWFLGEKLEFEQPVFDPNDFETVALEKMGFFAQFADASGEYN